MRGEQLPQGFEVPEGAFVTGLQQGALPLRHPSAERRDPDASIH